MAEPFVTQPTLFGSKGDAAQDVGKPESDPDADEVEIVNSIWSGFQQSKQHKYSLVNPEDWRRYAMIYGGEHWSGYQKSWQSTPTINHAAAACNSILPVITDNKPQVAIIPREPGDTHIADVLRAIFEYIWEDRNLDVKLPATMLNTLVFGNGFWKVLWNPALERGLGDIQVVDVDPTCMFFNPEAKDIDDAFCIYHVEQMSLNRIRQLWPEKGEDIKEGVKDPDVQVYRPQVAQKGGGTSPGRIDVPTTTGSEVWSYPATASTRETPGKKDSATVCERWKFDTEEKRWERTVVAGMRVLEGPEFSDFDLAPFVHFADYKTNWSIWGSGEIQLVENLQHEINKRRGMILDILRFCASPMLVYDPGAGTDLENITVEPGTTIPAEGGPAAVSWLTPSVDLSGLFNVNDRDKVDMNDILGNTDLIQGRAPTGIEAGVALEQLADAANTRLRLKVRMMEASLRRFGMILIQFIQKHYTSMRIFRIVGKDFSQGGQANPAAQQQFFAINKPVGAQPMMDETGFPVIGDDGMPQQQPIYDETSNLIPPDAKFDVRVGAGSTLPVSRSSKFQQAITLFDRGALPLAELLKAAGWDRAEEIAMMMEQKAMMEQQGMMGMQQGASPEEVGMIPEGLSEA